MEPNAQDRSDASRQSKAIALLRELRPEQWSKNLLVLVPAFLAHEMLATERMLAVVFAFIGLCLGASGVYVLNDLADLEADRAHPVKRRRPFASGSLPVNIGPPLAATLIVLGTAIAGVGTSARVAGLVVLYVAVNLAYSFGLKRVALVDVFVLAGLYALRILVGGVAAGVPVSRWLLAFSIFLFLSLAIAKRYAELARLRGESEHRAVSRGYVVPDLDLLVVVGTCSGYIAVLVLALYVNSPDVLPLYARPDLLWGICLLLLFWITRLWLLAHRERLDEDPVVFVLRDPASLVIAVLSAAIIFVAAS